VEESCEHGNESSGSIKCREILELAAQLAGSQERLISMQLVVWLCRLLSCHIRDII
jgi:hypothetical protein